MAASQPGYSRDSTGGYVVAGVAALALIVPLIAGRVGGEEFVCARGVSPLAILLMVELGVALAGALILTALRDRISSPLLDRIAEERWSILIAIALVSLPFLIAALTESSACERGRAFFWESVLIETFILAMMAISYNLLFGFAGVVSFGHAAFFGVGAYTAGVLTLKFGWAWGPAILATLAFGLLIALIMGVVGLRLKGLYFAMFTLAFAEVLFLLASNRIMTGITGAEDGLIYEVPEFLNATTNRLFVYYLVLALMIASFLLVRRLMHSPTGRVLSAIRDNENRAQMLGYNTFHFKLIAMLLSGLIATLSGLLLGIVNKGANAPLLGVGVTVDALLQTIIGGLGTFAGPVVGAFGLHLLEFLLRDLKVPVGETTLDIGTNWALFLGAIFILAVLAFPQGIVGTIQSRRLNTLDGWLRWLRLRRT